MLRIFGRNRNKTQAITRSEPALSWATEDGLIRVDFPPYVANNMRQLIARIESRQPLPRRLGILSALREEGVTYMARAIATTIANDLRAEVCIVDLNWWSPSITTTEGLNAVLTGSADLSDAILSTDYPNLYILPAGELSVAERPTVVRSQALNKVFADLDQQFDYLVLDIPAILVNSESIPLASKADACCFVIRQGATSSGNVRQAMEEVSHLNLLGVVMNQVKTHTPEFLLRLLPPD